MMEESPSNVNNSLRASVARCLLLTFANFSVWLAFAAAVQMAEGGREVDYKCGT